LQHPAALLECECEVVHLCCVLVWLPRVVAEYLSVCFVRCWDPDPGLRAPGRACQGGVCSADLCCPPHADAPPDPRDQRGDGGHPGLGRVCGHRQSHAALGRKRRCKAPVVRRHRSSSAPVHGVPGGKHPWYVKLSVCVIRTCMAWRHQGCGTARPADLLPNLNTNPPKTARAPSRLLSYALLRSASHWGFCAAQPLLGTLATNRHQPSVACVRGCLGRPVWPVAPTPRCIFAV